MRKFPRKDKKERVKTALLFLIEKIIWKMSVTLKLYIAITTVSKILCLCMFLLFMIFIFNNFSFYTNM